VSSERPSVRQRVGVSVQSAGAVQDCRFRKLGYTDDLRAILEDFGLAWGKH
jgi:hypothetical protein